ncbi:MAG: response regulator [bacterium]
MERGNILIVESEPDTIAFLERAFAQHGYNLVEARDGIEGVKRIYESPPDLIILDVALPKMPGYRICRLLKEDGKHCRIPVIIMGPGDNPSARDSALAVGADAYISKPPDADILLETVQDLLKGYFDAKPSDLPAEGHIDSEEIISKVNAMLDRKLHELMTLNAIIKAVVSTLDINEILEIIVRSVIESLGFDSVRLALVSKDGRTLEGKVSLSKGGQPEGFDLNIPLDRASQKPAVLAVLDGRPYHTIHSDNSSQGAPPTRETLDVPVIAMDKVLGIIEVGSFSSNKPITRMEEESLLNFANYAGIAIDNATTHEDQRRQKQELEAAYEKLKSLNEELTLKNRELRDAQAQLLEKERLSAIGELAVGVSHQMNQPLGAVKGYLYLLQKDLEAEGKTNPRIAKINEKVEELAEIAKGLQNIVRLYQMKYVNGISMIDIKKSSV